jgi:hypothetical protein
MSKILKSKDIKCLPLGSKMIVRAYLKPQGALINLKAKEIVPCVEVMRIGPDVKYVKEDQWVLIRDGITPGQFKYGDELFYFIQEHDVSVIFDEKPDYEMIMGTDTSIVRDLTEYVKVDKLSKLKAKISEKDESEVLTESTTILDLDGNPIRLE